MALNTGTYTMADLQAVTNQTVAAFGPDAVAASLDRELAIHNGLITEAIRTSAEITADPLRRTGITGSGEMIVANDTSRAPTQKVGQGGTVGFPMDLMQIAVGWTQRYLNKATVSEVATAQANIQAAHARAVMRQMKRALYNPTNLDTTDYTQRNPIALPVKRFYNADGWSIPSGPNGEAFTGGSHTHYIGSASLTAAALLSAVTTVVEHTAGGRVQVYINAADEAAVSALAGFKAYPDPRQVVGNTDGTNLQRLDLNNPGNRAIGTFGVAEVWVKPWAVANYAAVLDIGAPEKPLVLRTENGQQPTLVRVAENNAFPLIAQFYESVFGFGALNRGAGAVLYFASGTYAAPTIA